MNLNNPTNILSSGIEVIKTLAVGFFMLAFLFFFISETKTGFDNYNFIQSLDVVDTGRLHVFDGRDFTVGMADYGVPRKCIVLIRDSDSSFQFTDATVAAPGGDPIPANTFCADNIVTKAFNWELYTNPQPGSTGERIFQSIVVCLVMLSGGYLVMRIPALLVGLFSERAFYAYRLVTILFMAPVFLFCAFFLHGLWSYSPSYWNSSVGTVTTDAVYITRDGSLYKAPDNMYSWTDTDTGNKLTY